jgi:nucleotide-binding universal stress UspA family protein
VTLAVGLARDGRGTGALRLAAMLARSSGEDILVCAVIPEPWPAGPAKVDAEYQRYLHASTTESLNRARVQLPAELAASFEVVQARSTPAGLLRVAERGGVSMLVLGSSVTGPMGQVGLGSVAERVLHASPAPVALAPRGFRARPDARVERVTASFGAASGAEALVLAAGALATRLGAGLRLASFAVRPPNMLTAGVGSHAEDAVFAEWRGHIERAQRAAADKLGALDPAPEVLEPAIGYGRDWRAAIDEVPWTAGDLLVVGSSSVGPLASVFLGSRASKIVRNSPMPVVVVPRS